MSLLANFKNALQQDLLRKYEQEITNLAFKYFIPLNQTELTSKQVTKITIFTAQYARIYDQVANSLYTNDQLLNFLVK
ncbi:hypothetical protein SS50377_25525 [Spironucleus salmonicida]|uniref:Uncharacterized protein n=1 Tax=Spironucleus salmonicida TaxID=348837 RepID=V6LL31_9EUKA|nr:hypothetical protein SS50377_25525 [Spironucleus salmonicida]|eukprot:EST45073.1 hypothetical protein SS50377_15093 [Spironucleus salmonicida]